MLTPPSSRLSFQARIRKPAYFDALQRHGCETFTVYNRTYTPNGFHDPVSEYWDLLNGVVMWPAAGERQLEISGPDAARFVQLLTPRNLSKMQVGQCKYVLITAADGGIVNDPICLRIDEDRFWLSAADSDLMLYAKGVNALANMDIELRDPDVAVIQIQGPRSREFMQTIAGAAIDDLRYFWWCRANFGGSDVVISRTGWSNEWGYEVYILDPSHGNPVFDFLVTAGEAFDMRLGVVSQIRRIEGGMLSYGLDMGLEHNPYEIGLGRLVDLDQTAPFIGKEALRALAAEEPARKLVGVSMSGPALSGFIKPWLVYSGGEPVSKVTSLAYSPRLERNLGLTILPAALTATGTILEVEAASSGDRVRAEVAALPFVPRRVA